MFTIQDKRSGTFAANMPIEGLTWLYIESAADSFTDEQQAKKFCEKHKINEKHVDIVKKGTKKCDMFVADKLRM